MGIVVEPNEIKPSSDPNWKVGPDWKAGVKLVGYFLLCVVAILPTIALTMVLLIWPKALRWDRRGIIT